nr:MAG TPA: hypothetical protein [Caudoviricetes sp.]
MSRYFGTQTNNITCPNNMQQYFDNFPKILKNMLIY